MKATPRAAKIYFFLAALCFALPAINKTIYPSRTGQLLVSPMHSAPPFDDVVIYIVKHDLFHAHGIILNKPMNDAPMIGGKTVFSGGPVNSGAVAYYALTGDNQPYIGYTGWGPLQLDYELFRGSWHVIEATPDLIKEPSEAMWNSAIEKVRQKYGSADSGLL